MVTRKEKRFSFNVSIKTHEEVESKRKKNETQEDCLRRLMYFKPFKRDKSKVERSMIPKHVKENMRKIKYGKRKK